MRLPTRFLMRGSIALAVAALLQGCASFSLERSVDQVNAEAGAFTQGQLQLARDAQQGAQREQAATALLAKPLGQDEAVRLALIGSPALQALLAQRWAEGTATAQDGRVPNPLLSLERVRTGEELEIGRTLSFGLLDLLTLPLRQRVAEQRLAQQQIRLTAEVVEHVTQIRQAWVRAVASEQLARYAQQVYDSAEASAELAKRMQAVGNYSRLARAREQAFYADAAARLATSRHQALAAREALVRLLGLSEQQAQSLKLPERLPDLPRQALPPEQAGQQASRQRLDIQLARAELDAAARAQGLGGVTTLTDIELGVIRNSHFAPGERGTGRGAEISLRLPVFDGGGLQRQAMNARTLAAAQQLEAAVRAAGSHLREGYAAYRTAHDLARHYRDEVVPLRKTIAEENLLRYNAMQIGVFELLADSREQVATVMAAIDAEQQFWLADAALRAQLMGKPVSLPLAGPAASSSAPAAAH